MIMAADSLLYTRARLIIPLRVASHPPGSASSGVKSLTAFANKPLAMEKVQLGSAPWSLPKKPPCGSIVRVRLRESVLTLFANKPSKDEKPKSKAKSFKGELTLFVNKPLKDEKKGLCGLRIEVIEPLFCCLYYHWCKRHTSALFSNNESLSLQSMNLQREHTFVVRVLLTSAHKPLFMILKKLI